ncbi:MAG: hypothetical protein JOZ02_02635 [Acidobacteria bacterium]|nr:hypothetical protein [Acidobacteriota bacterium]
MRLPRTDPELVLWLNNFAAAFATHAAALGFTTAEVDSVNAANAMVSFLVGDFLPTYKSALKAGTTYKDRVISGPVGPPATPPPPAPTTATPPAAVPPGILARLRTLVQRIQLSPAYTEEIGLALGITGTGDGGPSAPDSSPKPTLKARSNGPGVVQLDFSKEKFDGVFVESRRPGEDGWQSLGIDNYSPFIDDRPPLEAGKPERREYRVRYLLRDQATGEWSDIVTATFVP